jgi:oxygen-independent coproporphyrinogen-3 oxidase
MLSPEEIRRILECVRGASLIEPNVEITVECHPATVDIEKLRGYRSAGVTRLSFGAESFQSGELARVGRSYHPDRVQEAVEIGRHAGFANVALDLMFGLPGQTSSSWEATLRAALAAGVDHVSLYPLAIEPRTVFSRRLREGKLNLPGDDAVVEMYGIACRVLSNAGFEHYEVANWARPGRRCQHNLSYWSNREFLGVGVGAHGYLSPYRTENLSGTSRYIRVVMAGDTPVVHRELIDNRIELGESIMLRLRLLADGLDMDELDARFDLDFRALYARDLAELQERDLLVVTGHVARIPEEAVPLANEVWKCFV